MNALDSAWEVVKREFETACGQAARAARSQVTSDLNHAARRFRLYQSEEDWAAALIDAVQWLVSEAALFFVQKERLLLRAKYRLEFPVDYSLPIVSAAAFANAISSKDSIVALRTPGEVGDILGTAGIAQRAHIVPILNGERVAAVLFAANEDRIDLNGLELLATLASLVLERHTRAPQNVQIAAMVPSSTPRPAQNQALPSWAALGDEERNLHLRAQRFSRVRVADMQLSRPEACRAGLEQNDVYLFLKKEIDAAREAYRATFMVARSMVDYLHLELVRRAAEGEESKLGADYPGQLV